MSSESPKTIFFTGATGYIGGAALGRLLDDKSFKITALVRSAEKARKLNELGIATVVAPLDDAEALASAAAEADIVHHNADSADNLPAIQAILKGMKRRFEKIGQAPILIHTSGTGVLTDKAAGMFESDTIYYDNNVEQIESLPPTAVHRPVDLEIVAADGQGYIKSYIILPASIWGELTGRLVDLGISNKHSVQIPFAVRAGATRGQGGMIGEGKNIWPQVEIHDVADLYDIVLHAALSGTAPHGREGFFFAENGEHQIIDVARAYTKSLHELGKSKSPEPVSYTEEEIEKYFGNVLRSLGSNGRARAVRGRELGWLPAKGTEGFLKSIPVTTAIIVEEWGL